MRLRDYRKRIKEIIPKLKITASTRTNNPVTYTLINIFLLKEGVEQLENLGLFKENLNKLKNTSFYSQSQDKIVINSQEYNLIIKETTSIIESLNLFIELLNNILPADEINLISIKIPNPFTFKDIEKTTNKLNIIFSQTLLDENIGGKIQVVNFDTGSYWIDILVDGVNVVGLVAAISWSAAVAYKKIQEGRFINEQVQALKISNEAYKEILSKQSEAFDKLIEIEAEHLKKEYYNDDNNEILGRLKLAIKELSELYDKGTEIHPSIGSAKDVVKLFPNFNELNSIESRIKKLTEKTK